MSNKPWDEGMKRMANHDPDALLQWLLPGAEFVSMLPLELDLTEFDVDLLLKVVWKGKEILLHVEFQTRNDYKMGDRTVRYNVLAHCEYTLPVLSVVIYLFPEGNIPASPVVWNDVPNFETLRFHFVNYKLNDMTVDELLALDNVGLLPLIPLTRDGAERGPVQYILDRLNESGDEDLLFLGYNFAYLVFQRLRPENLAWLKGRYRFVQEMFEQSGLIQELKAEWREKALEEGLHKGLEEGLHKGLEEGLHKGLEEGLHKGIQEGQITEARASILETVEVKYPSADMLQLTNSFITQIKDREALKTLRIQMLKSATREDARTALLAWAKSNGIPLH